MPLSTAKETTLASNYSICSGRLINPWLLNLKQRNDVVSERMWYCNRSFGVHIWLLVHSNKYVDVWFSSSQLSTGEKFSSLARVSMRGLPCESQDERTNYFSESHGARESQSSREWRSGATPMTDCESDAQDGLGPTLLENRINKEAGACALNDNYHIIRATGKVKNWMLGIQCCKVLVTSGVESSSLKYRLKLIV